MALEGVELLSEHGAFGGSQRFYKHVSVDHIGLPMRFALYLPPLFEQAKADHQKSGQARKIPLLTYLAGLTCTEETATMKAGAQRVAAELGLALLFPDTSPRHTGIEGENRDWDFGTAAGFYLDATEHPWANHWRMESYLIKELIPGVVDRFGLDATRLGIMGHSMGGHGALTLALRHPGMFRSVSAFAPICAPTQCPWGRKAFTGYLGNDEANWPEHDASALMAAQTAAPFPEGILIDQGLSDQFLAEQLHPEMFEAACAKVGQLLTLRRQQGYDHGYYFIASFIEDHLRHHAARL